MMNGEDERYLLSRHNALANQSSATSASIPNALALLELDTTVASGRESLKSCRLPIANSLRWFL
ncbi:hypothetical protein TRIATDRAFT_291590 [Trichoderma atroviride IMI 206040]|uniref:Uncharacterized protein n=1 Tax=Hypocrea atroviridis (strain ATCC 20476 / IMI 206040) TaxID=452589 RepID=G9NSK3_HYPAI|nr:uncharacterized protein TRIATDRAFT_291590 [Trichoderma atroviride IMI 206040]EHK46401.1 hypothetical protein TRIATDRAFT_291590 [Trichoderma atroviride IMI 206040]